MIICNTCGIKKPTKNYCSNNCRVQAFRKKTILFPPGTLAKEEVLWVPSGKTHTIGSGGGWNPRRKSAETFTKPCKHGMILGVGSCKFGCT